MTAYKLMSCFTLSLRVSLLPAARAALSSLRSGLAQFGYRVRTLSGNPTQNNTSSFYAIASQLSLTDLNRILYRCSAEEESDGKGSGGYNVPNHGNLVYCGLQGLYSPSSETKKQPRGFNSVSGIMLRDNIKQENNKTDYIKRENNKIDYIKWENNKLVSSKMRIFKSSLSIWSWNNMFCLSY